MKPEIYISSVILVTALFIIISGFIVILKPSQFLFKKNKKKLNFMKITIFSLILSSIITLFVAWFSNKLDIISTRVKK